MNRFFKAALLTGLFVGTTDILLAYTTLFIKSGKFPERIFHYIAGGALGLEKSLPGGAGVAFLGLFFHYFIAISFTFFFFWIFPKLKFLSFNKYLVGILYAVFVTHAVQLIIFLFTPLPAPGKFILEREFIGWILLGIVLGIPIAYNAYKFYGIKNPPLDNMKNN